MHRSLLIALAGLMLATAINPAALATGPATPPPPEVPQLCDLTPYTCFSLQCPPGGCIPNCESMPELCQSGPQPVPCTTYGLQACVDQVCNLMAPNPCNVTIQCQTPDALDCVNNLCESAFTFVPCPGGMPVCYGTAFDCLDDYCAWAGINPRTCTIANPPCDTVQECADYPCTIAQSLCNVQVPCVGTTITVACIRNLVCENALSPCDGIALPCSGVDCVPYYCDRLGLDCSPEAPCDPAGSPDACIENVCNTFSPSPCVAGPITGMIPGNGVGEETPGEVHVDPIVIVSPITVPGVPGIEVYVPPVTTAPVTVPYTCTPFGILCVGPATIPAQTIGGQTVHVTDPIPPTPVTGPMELPPATTVPLPLTAALSVSHGDIVYSADANLGETSSIGPITTEVPGPFGPIPVGLCMSGCPVPVAPGASVSTSVTVTVRVGDETVSHTVPVSATTV